MNAFCLQSKDVNWIEDRPNFHRRNLNFFLGLHNSLSFFNKSVTALFLLGELEPYAYHTRLKIDQQKQNSYTFIKKTERTVVHSVVLYFNTAYRGRALPWSGQKQR
jgi:hypothetical protein